MNKQKIQSTTALKMQQPITSTKIQAAKPSSTTPSRITQKSNSKSKCIKEVDISTLLTKLICTQQNINIKEFDKTSKDALKKQPIQSKQLVKASTPIKNATKAQDIKKEPEAPVQQKQNLPSPLQQQFIDNYIEKYQSNYLNNKSNINESFVESTKKYKILNQEHIAKRTQLVQRVKSNPQTAFQSQISINNTELSFPVFNPQQQKINNLEKQVNQLNIQNKLQEQIITQLKEQLNSKQIILQQLQNQIKNQNKQINRQFLEQQSSQIEDNSCLQADKQQQQDLNISYHSFISTQQALRSPSQGLMVKYKNNISQLQSQIKIWEDKFIKYEVDQKVFQQCKQQLQIQMSNNLKVRNENIQLKNQLHDSINVIMDFQQKYDKLLFEMNNQQNNNVKEAETCDINDDKIQNIQNDDDSQQIQQIASSDPQSKRYSEQQDIQTTSGRISISNQNEISNSNYLQTSYVTDHEKFQKLQKEGNQYKQELKDINDQLIQCQQNKSSFNCDDLSMSE